VPSEQLNTAKAIIENYMINAAELNVPLEVGIGTGINWEVAH